MGCLKYVSWGNFTNLAGSLRLRYPIPSAHSQTEFADEQNGRAFSFVVALFCVLNTFCSCYPAIASLLDFRQVLFSLIPYTVYA